MYLPYRLLFKEYEQAIGSLREDFFAEMMVIRTCCGKRLCTCPMGEESCLGGFGKGPIAEREFGSSGPSRPRKRVYRHSNALRHEGATKELMSQGRFLLPSDIGPYFPFRNRY